MQPQVILEESAPRDGLQNEARIFSVEERVWLVEALAACGFPRIQVGSFVSPRAVPQMADTEAVYGRIQKRPGVVYSVLVLNEKGLERAVACGVDHVAVFTSASETHSRKNTGCSVDEGLGRAAAVVRRALEAGMTVQAGVMNAFGCRFDGSVPRERVRSLLFSLREAGAQELSLADTSGMAHPRQMEEVLEPLLADLDVPLALHLHDTWGFALANIYAAWKMGVNRFDTALGGLGGCPFLPGAPGNVASEDVVHLFESMGVCTGVDPKPLVRVVKDLERKLGRALSGHFSRVQPTAACEDVRP
ncbi:hydroxymethylglutaryl-CoA lyase [Desulfacinum hydrothermale DSM 13146]|uniref:Hydroxymethylglutaryl-CoA lyase n=1 Tax=Desulfacinum hydrothermale DSM 13146 TaxID=1121390 RepID=A0A1W1X1F0_9BACT|nr:hydroxymethylglutaryl-CoA lyase [Desulfacinum hydrothermale]SMC17735.1 hydroxymethylglutaryl-CoA lyase [Desulfacinum hydrothermale DSM 13146]